MDKVLIHLLNYIEHQDYKGYDPYDALASSFPITKFGKYFSYGIMQVQVRNPINIRPLLGIKKQRGVKSIALILESYVRLYQSTKDIKYLNKAEGLLDWIESQRLDNFSGNCWAIHFPIAWTDNNRPKNDPSSVLACFVFNAIFELYLVSSKEKTKELLLGIVEFIESHVPVTKTDKGLCYSYTTRKRDIIFNANMLVGEVFAKTYFLTENQKYKDIAKSCIDFNLSYQKEDGHWNYKLNEDTNQEKKQIDFHQGFMLTSLYEYNKYANDNREEIYNSLKKGLNFYATKQFNSKGVSLYRYPKFWPIDIHNQAVGIITFTKLQEFGSEYGALGEKILDWTNKNMYNNKRSFYYYRKHPLFTNKISYMRWSQSWMLLALSQRIKK